MPLLIKNPVELLAGFPWDICRTCYSYPESFSVRFVKGFSSLDYDFLILNAMNDANVIMREWLDWEHRAFASLYDDTPRTLTTDAMFMQGVCLRALQPLPSIMPVSAATTNTAASAEPATTIPSSRVYFYMLARAFLFSYQDYGLQDLLEAFLLAITPDRDDINAMPLEEVSSLRSITANHLTAEDLSILLQTAFTGLKHQLVSERLIEDPATVTQPPTLSSSSALQPALEASLSRKRRREHESPRQSTYRFLFTPNVLLI